MPSLNDTVARVHQARAAAFRTFKAKWEQMQQNSDFIRLQQYSQKQLLKMDEQKRVPYVLDYLNSAMNTFQGIQRDRRTEIFYYGVESGDEVKAEVLNAVKDATLQQNNFIYKESDVFQDGLIQKVGAVEFEWSREKNKNGALNIIVVPPRQLMWDLNGNEFDKTDCTWISRHRLYGKRELKNKYPEKTDIIDKMPAINDIDLGVFDDLRFPEGYLDSLLDIDLGMIAMIEFWEKKYELRWFIQDKESGLVRDLYYDSKKEAQAAVKEEKQKTEATFTEQGVIAPEVNVEVFSDTFPVIVKSETAHDVAFVEEETQKEPFYPLSIYHPFWVDRDWYSPLDIVKDGQRYHNKMFSMADHWIGTASKGTILTDSKNPDEVNRVKEAIGGLGGVITVEDVEAYKEFKAEGPNPQIFGLMDKAENQIHANSGGRNFQGQKETASESGIAVRQRIEQGGLSGFIIYDNLRRWKMDVGSKIAWYLTTNLTYADTVRIEGEELVQETMQKFQSVNQGNWFRANPFRPGVGYLKVNTEGKNTIENLKVDTIVDEARWSVSKNQSILQEISVAMQSNPNLAQTFPPEVMVHFMNLPFSLKQQALQRIKELEQMQQALQMAKAQPPPSISASMGDAEKLPAQAFAAWMQKFMGIQIDPSTVQDPNVLKAHIDLATAATKMGMEQDKHRQDMAMKSDEHQQGILMDAQRHDQAMQTQREKDALAVQGQQLKNLLMVDKAKNNGGNNGKE